MAGPTMCELKEIDIDKLWNVVFFIVFFEFFEKLDKMRALAEFFPDSKAVLIWVVNVFELVHEVGSAFFRYFVDGAVVAGSIQDLLLLIPFDHANKIDQSKHQSINMASISKHINSRLLSYHQLQNDLTLSSIPATILSLTNAHLVRRTLPKLFH